MTNTSDDPIGDRRPSRHEQTSGRPWDASYQDERPAPWDIGRPQAAFVRAAEEGAFHGTVLDAGCGTGEHALLAAGLGLPVLGVDVAETAIAMARSKAEVRGLQAEFEVADACRLDRLGRQFGTVLDCGLFHTFDAVERPAYVASLASVTQPGATLCLLCFGDGAPAFGPHPVSQDELREAFGDGGWTVASIEHALIQTTFVESGFPAWFATISRV